MADCQIDGMIRSGTQQQWFTRTSAIGGWQEANWNMMFMGTLGTPPTRFPDPPATTLSEASVIREKPFLFVPAEDAWRVAVPSLTWQAREPNWPRADPAARSYRSTTSSSSGRTRPTTR